MILNGLNKIAPDKRDFSLLHTYGAGREEASILPPSYSIYDGQPIPNQVLQDFRFTPPLDSMPYGCTGESGAFESSLQDNDLYNPRDLYLNTPPFTNGTGRNIRDMFKVLIDRGVRDNKDTLSPKRIAYFNVYGANGLDDFDAARIALWINQSEKRGVYIGSWWYGNDWQGLDRGILPVPSFKTDEASLHCYICTGWTTIDEQLYLEAIPWCGDSYGDKGRVYVSRSNYNTLMAQPYTGAFTITKVGNSSGSGTAGSAVPIGIRANFDHLWYLIRQFFRNL